MKTARLMKAQITYQIPEVKLLLVREPQAKKTPAYIHTPDDIEALLEPLRHYPEEHFVTLHMNVRLQVTGYTLVSHGTISASLVNPREVFKTALLANSHAIVLAHNHPTGITDPSPEDMAVTKQLIKAGVLLNVQVLDHMIIGDGPAYSFRQHHPSLFPTRD